MRYSRVDRAARRLGLSREEAHVFHALRHPADIQSFVDTLTINHEAEGETILSVRSVLRQRHAHCIEAAMVAACAFYVHGSPPLLLHLDCAAHDYPHVVALFRVGNRIGAISKSNGIYLRYRDPVYRGLRELAMSYFHEYCDDLGARTLRSYSMPMDLRLLDPTLWVTNESACTVAHDRLVSARHYPLVSPKQVRELRPQDKFERKITSIREFARG